MAVDDGFPNDGDISRNSRAILLKIREQHKVLRLPVRLLLCIQAWLLVWNPADMTCRAQNENDNRIGSRYEIRSGCEWHNLCLYFFPRDSTSTPIHYSLNAETLHTLSSQLLGERHIEELAEFPTIVEWLWAKGEDRTFETTGRLLALWVGYVASTQLPQIYGLF